MPPDGIKINDVWPHAHNGSLYFIQRLIEMNLNIGAFTKEEDELIAWCLRFVAPSTCFISHHDNFLFLSTESKWEVLEVCKLTSDSSAVVSDHWLWRSCQSVYQSSARTWQLASLIPTTSHGNCSKSSALSTSMTPTGSRLLPQFLISDGLTKSLALRVLFLRFYFSLLLRLFISLIYYSLGFSWLHCNVKYDNRKLLFSSIDF